jgi:uncharacterized protein YqgV (UPF0045/DUF77 family)
MTMAVNTTLTMTEQEAFDLVAAAHQRRFKEEPSRVGITVREDRTVDPHYFEAETLDDAGEWIACWKVTDGKVEHFSDQPKDD